MKKMILVSGGARSGKSEFAESLVNDQKNLYIATSIPFDSEMKRRIEIHKKRRASNWKTIEIYKNFEKIIEKEEFNYSENLFLDCITLMINNIMMEIIEEDIKSEDEEKIEEEVKEEIDKLINICKKCNKNLILVTNELGFGMVPENRMSRIFRDISGRINKYLAKQSDEVYMVFMGISNRIK